MLKCSVCPKEAVSKCGHGCETLYCGKKCAQSVYEVHRQIECVGEGVADFNTVESYSRSFAIKDPSKRKIIIDATYRDVKDTYEAERRGNRWAKNKLIKKLETFSQALTEFVSNRKDLNLTTEERRAYAGYVQQVDAWKSLLKTKK